MNTGMTLRAKVIGMMVGSSLLTMICVSALFLHSMWNENERTIDNYRSTLTAAVERELKNETQVAVSVIEEVRKKQLAGELTEAQARKEAADRVRDLRYDEGKGYFWIDTSNGVNVVLLGRDTEGKSRWDATDPSGRKFIQEMIANGKQPGGGFTDLMFPKPNETEPLPKRNYTVTYAPYDWVLGTGIWIDDIDEKVAQQEEAATQAFVSSMIGMAIFIVILEAILLALAVWAGNKIVAPIGRVTAKLHTLSTGDFRHKGDTAQDAQRSDEIGEMTRGLRQLQDSVGNMMQQVKESSQQVAQSASQLKESSSQSAVASGQVADSIVTVAGSCSEQFTEVETAGERTEELSRHMENFAKSVVRTVKAVEHTKNNADEGERKVTEAVKQMRMVEDTVSDSAKVIRELGQESDKIGAIVDAISQIAEQTNLLALNAAIEAARAGEHGRGFAVVADEVRKLAEQSSTSAGEIAALIGNIQEKAGQAVKVMEDGVIQVQSGAEAVNGAGTSFHEIAGMVSQVAEESEEMERVIKTLTSNTADISKAIEKISAMSRNVASETETVSAATEEQTATMHEIAGASQTLSDMAKTMEDSVGKFRI